MSPPLSLSVAVSDYDHVSDLMRGRVQVEGVELTCLSYGALEIFHRFINYREWDVSEMSLAKYVSMRSQGDESLVAIPVFPSRMFRQSAIWVRPEGPDSPRDLVGAKVGIPEWAQTAGVYARGFLMHEYGVNLASVQWFQAGLHEAGRLEKVALDLPPDVSYTPVLDRNLEDLLIDREVDAVIAAESPHRFIDGSGRIRRMFVDYIDVEGAYWEKTGIYPIMHVIVVKGEVLERHPWVAMNLLVAFEESKRRAVARLRNTGASRVALPWAQYHAEKVAGLFPDGDYWPYGIEANRSTLEPFLEFALEQGVVHRRLAVEDVFPPQVRTRVRI